MKATKQYFPVVLFIMLYKVVLTFGSVDEILRKSYLAVLFLWYCLFCFTRWLSDLYSQYIQASMYLLQLFFLFFINCTYYHCNKNHKKSLSKSIQMKATRQYFSMVLFIMLGEVVKSVYCYYKTNFSMKSNSSTIHRRFVALESRPFRIC